MLVYIICIYFFFFFQTACWISLILQARIKQESLWCKWQKISLHRYKQDVAHFESKQRFKRQNLGLQSCYFVFFFVSSIHGKGCLRWKAFPPKNLEKYKVRALKLGMRQFFVFYSVSNICSNVANFPAKRLGKNTVPKIRMRRFFFSLKRM